MCVTCDCGELEDSHGEHGEHTAHITRAQFEAAAQAAEITPIEAALNILKVYVEETVKH